MCSASNWSPLLLRKKRVYTVGGIVQGIPCFATRLQRAHLSTKLPVLVHAPAVLLVSLFVGVSARGLRKGGGLGL